MLAGDSRRSSGRWVEGDLAGHCGEIRENRHRDQDPWPQPLGDGSGFFLRDVETAACAAQCELALRLALVPAIRIQRHGALGCAMRRRTVSSSAISFTTL